MHTSSVSYHRIVFNNVTDYPSLHELSIVLGLEATNHPDIFDLVQNEGYSLTPKGAIEAIGEAYGLNDGDEDTFTAVLSELQRKAEEIGYQPFTRVFDESYHNPAIETDINDDELYDLLTVMAGQYFSVECITTQWSMFSNKTVAGAHTGGSRITTRNFSIPVVMGCDEMESNLNALAKHEPHEVGDYYVNTFVRPLVGEYAIKDGSFRKSVARALIRTSMMELDQGEIEEIIRDYRGSTAR